MRKLSGDGVSLQLGMLSSANCLAVAPTLPNQNVVLVTTGCTNDGLTGTPGQTAPYPNLFRVNTPDSLIVSALGKTIAKKFPQITNYTAFGYDYVTGKAEWKLYQETVKANGLNLNVSRETFVPLAEQNFRPYVSSLAGDPGDPATKALYLGLYGGGTAGFLQQAPDFSLGAKYGLVVQPGGYYPVARALNGKAPDVWNSYDYNYAAFNSDLNTKFVTDFTAKTGKKPVSWSYDAYQGVYAYAAAIKKAGSTDSAAVGKALAGIQYDSPVGKLSIDAKTHQSNTPAVVFESVGDPTAPEGVKIKATEIVQPGQ